MLSQGTHEQFETAVLKTVASTKIGIDELAAAIELHLQHVTNSEKKIWLLTERVYQLIQQKKMKGVEKDAIRKSIASQLDLPGFNLFNFANKYNDAS
jgi:LAO/AO transport system kinase